MKQSLKNSQLFQGLLFGGAMLASLRPLAVLTSATLATGSIFALGLTPCLSAVLEESPKTVIDEVWQIVNREYVGESFNRANWQATRQELLSKNYTSHEQAYKVIRAALNELNDPYTRFLNPEEFEELTSQTSGELSGIGIRMEIDEQTKLLSVVEPLENSPAMNAGIKAGDKILKIDGKPTSLLSLEQASKLIRGEEGTEITLQLSREGKGVFEISLARAQIELPSVRSTLRQEGQLRVGYIKLNEFSSHAAEQMQRAIENLEDQKVEAFVLDLRGNPGGLLFASVDIARMWMETGTIVRTVDRQEGELEFSANQTALTDLPLVVLVDGKSASASEILAGALKDNKRATIVGTSTYGKGTVQSVHSLSDGSGVAVTISQYYPPSGVDISKKGIAPDIELGLTGEQQLLLAADPSLVGTSDDPQYARAITFLSRRASQTQPSSEPISIR